MGVEYVGPLSTRLNKRWFVLRHGRSEANEAGIVASQLANAENAYGLTDTGQTEVEVSVNQAVGSLNSETPLKILMSPFLRTRQTAEIAGRILEVHPEIDHRLIERDFGDYELLSDQHYENVWKADPKSPEDLPGKVETVYDVADRVTDLVMEVESDRKIKTCLLVTHCDVAMILSCVFQNIDPRFHRSLDPIRTGEIRRLKQLTHNSSEL